MLPDWVSNPGPLSYESGALPIALCGPARTHEIVRKNVIFAFTFIMTFAYLVCRPSSYRIVHILWKRKYLLCNFAWWYAYHSAVTEMSIVKS